MALTMDQEAIFMDRDGTICEEVNFLNDLSKLKLIKGSAEAIRMINQSGMKAVVVTNQSGIGRGLFTEGFVNNVHKRLKKMLESKGAFLDGIYYCPHLPETGCSCRKPETGMLNIAAKDMKIDLKRSYVVGDKAIDIELADRACAKGVMVKTGYGENELCKLSIAPYYVAGDILEAVKWILRDKSS